MTEAYRKLNWALHGDRRKYGGDDDDDEIVFVFPSRLQTEESEWLWDELNEYWEWDEDSDYVACEPWFYPLRARIGDSGLQDKEIAEIVGKELNLIWQVEDEAWRAIEYPDLVIPDDWVEYLDDGERVSDWDVYCPPEYTFENSPTKGIFTLRTDIIIGTKHNSFTYNSTVVNNFTDYPFVAFYDDYKDVWRPMKRKSIGLAPAWVTRHNHPYPKGTIEWVKQQLAGLEVED